MINLNQYISIRKIILNILFTLLIISIILNGLFYYLYTEKRQDFRNLCSTIEPNIILHITEKPFDYIVIENPTSSMSTVLKDSEYSFGINGGYFDGTYGNAKHAGYLSINGTMLYNSKIDAQITSYAVLNYKENSLKFISNNDFNESNFNGSDYTIFQTGPMIIKDSKVVYSEIDNSFNGTGCFYRSFLGYIPEDKMFIYGITNQKVTLTQVGEVLLINEELKGKTFSIINLDGGPSTAMYSSKDSSLNFNTEMELPYILGVR